MSTACDLVAGERTRVYVLRHGESDNVVAGRSGALPESPLTARGREQAASAAASLAGCRISRLYCSSAVRARQTAGIIASMISVPVDPIAGLAEMGIGAAEGATDPDTRRNTAEVLRAWIVDRDLDARVADGENGHQVVARVSAALDLIAARDRGRTVALVGHVASLTLGLSVACRLGSKVWGAPLPLAVAFPIEWDGARWHCSGWPEQTDGHQ